MLEPLASVIIIITITKYFLSNFHTVVTDLQPKVKALYHILTPLHNIHAILSSVTNSLFSGKFLMDRNRHIPLGKRMKSWCMYMVKQKCCIFIYVMNPFVFLLDMQTENDGYTQKCIFVWCMQQNFLSDALKLYVYILWWNNYFLQHLQCVTSHIPCSYFWG